MQWKVFHFVDCHPLQVFRFGISRVRPGIALCMSNHGVVTPRAVVVAKNIAYFKVGNADARFFGCFAACGVNRIFVAIECAAR